MKNSTTFRPRANFVWAGVAIFLDALFIVQTIFFSKDRSTIVLDLTIAAIAAGAVFALWLRPKLVLHETELTVVNPLTTVRISYSDILELETKWSLLIVHKNGKTRVWVAPANGKQRWIGDSAHRWKSSRIPVSSQSKAKEMTTVSQSLGSDSGIAAHLIRERINKKH